MPGPARSVLVVVVAAAALLTGCTSSDSTQALDPEVTHLQPGEPGEPNQVLTEAPPEDVFLSSAFNDSDVAFMNDMQVHHQQALAMTAMVTDRTEHEDLRLFVQRMEASQEGELEQLERLLAEHEEAVRRSGGTDHDAGTHSGHSADGDHSDMPGMLDDEELAALEAAEGDDFVRLFLVSMSQHHEGALAMVGELFADEGAAADPRLFEFAEHVDSDQRIEIDRMARMYAELPPG
ncbi:DUF305 domain-containing protein [Aquipuribacter sp. MA13-6]|uniref:DUF305 domain-containing protein n=1 Tax=unclassified Aquipuribacter TaxID=2635084 RepID=UPI003EECCF51